MCWASNKSSNNKLHSTFFEKKSRRRRNGKEGVVHTQSLSLTQIRRVSSISNGVSQRKQRFRRPPPLSREREVVLKKTSATFDSNTLCGASQEGEKIRLRVLETDLLAMRPLTSFCWRNKVFF